MYGLRRVPRVRESRRKKDTLSRGCDMYKDTEDWFVGKTMNFPMRLKDRELQVGIEGAEA